MSRVISNTSPLIVLAKADLLDVLPKLFGEITIPKAVRDEIMRGDNTDPMKAKLSKCLWLETKDLEPPLSPLATMNLGAGESEAIELARRIPNSRLLLDDRAGRRVARALGLAVLGTVGVLAHAAKARIIVSFDKAIAGVRQAGLFVSEEIIQAVQKELQQTTE